MGFFISAMLSARGRAYLPETEDMRYIYIYRMSSAVSDQFAYVI